MTERKPSEDKTPQSEEKAIKEPVPQTTPKRASKPQPTPLEQTVQAFVDGFDTRDFAARVTTELKIVGIETIKDLGPHRLADVNQALRAALRADVHALYGAAAAYRGDV